MSDNQYKRVLLKISGEALMGSADYGIEPAIVERLAAQVTQLHDAGTGGRARRYRRPGRGVSHVRYPREHGHGHR